MCDVYHARDESLAREVAVKILPGEVASDSELGCADSSRRPSRQRMLSHPNIWLATFGIRKGSVPSSQEHAAVLWRGLVRRKRMRAMLSHSQASRTLLHKYFFRSRMTTVGSSLIHITAPWETTFGGRPISIDPSLPNAGIEKYRPSKHANLTR